MQPGSDDFHLTDLGKGTDGVTPAEVTQIIMKEIDMTPRGIIKRLNLLRPIYRKTAAYGHFGRPAPEFTWERTDRAAALRADAGL